MISVSVRKDIEEMSKQIAAGASDMITQALNSAQNISRVSRRLPPAATPMQRLERDLYWDTFCTHKRYSPPEPGVKAQGIHRRCTKQECVAQREDLERQLAQIYLQTPPRGG